MLRKIMLLIRRTWKRVLLLWGFPALTNIVSLFAIFFMCATYPVLGVPTMGFFIGVGLFVRFAKSDFDLLALLTVCAYLIYGAVCSLVVSSLLPFLCMGAIVLTVIPHYLVLRSWSCWLQS